MLEPFDVSLIVPVFNGGASFARCLDALAALSPRPREIIIVDDGSTDDSRARAEQMRESMVSLSNRILSNAEGHAAETGVLRPVRYCPQSRQAQDAVCLCVLQTSRARSGPAIARNLAAAQARGALLFFVDADVLVKPDAVARVVATFNADASLAALYGSYDETPPAQNFVSQYKNLFHHYVHQDASGAATSFWAGCGAIRRDVFLSLGGFSESYMRPSIEDIELGYRLKRANYRTQLVKELQATHLKRWTLRSLLESDVRDRAVPWTLLILRDREFPADLNLKLSHRLSVALVGALLLSLGVGLLWPVALTVSALCALVLLAINRRLYAFFAARRGWWFAVRAIPLHWFYYWYSGVAFALGVALWLSSRSKAISRQDAKPQRS